MLTRAHGIAAFEPGRIVPDRLTRQKHGRYLAYAERALKVYRSGLGRTRRELHEAVENIFCKAPDCPPRRIAAFAKLLDDRGTYLADQPAQAAFLRQQVFRLAARFHPLVRAPGRQFEHEEGAVKAEIGRRLDRPWKEIDGDLFADVPEFHRLEEFEGYADGQALLARYNVAQAQVTLFDAVSMMVWATGDFKTILRYAKLAGLMHTIRRNRDGYEFRFDGPASLLRQTRRYGAAMARFLPALIACRGWRMHALIRTRRGRTVAFDLSPADHLTSHLPPPEEFDSHMEAEFARQWGPEKRDGWTLIREGEVLHRGQKVFVPDFVFRHDDGRRVLLEIGGFWTPEYIEAKLRTLRAFADHKILLALGAGPAKHLKEPPAGAICFKARLRIKDVLERLDRGR
jgi:predicted nuclease of restriction endonuclease-like RecB superfamily